jgi:tRNA1Val (adenine37-N6)-methyltransferase
MDENAVFCKEGERIDDLLSPSFRIIQHDKHFRFTIDAVMLGYFAQVKQGEKVIDLGTGTGVIPLLLAARQKPGEIIGLEIQPELVDMARRSVQLNHLQDRIHIENMNLNDAPVLLGHEIADVVVSNPPYRPLGRGDRNPQDAVAIAKHEVFCTLEDIVRTASQLLKYRGRFYMVHLAERLVDIVSLGRRYQLEAKSIRFIHSYSCDEAKLVLVQMYKGGNPPVKVLAPLIIYQHQGCYTEEVYHYYFPKEEE